jgi:hypothetical protein
MHEAGLTEEAANAFSTLRTCCWREGFSADCDRRETGESHDDCYSGFAFVSSANHPLPCGSSGHGGSSGPAASQSIDVPVKGTYFIRIGMHDPASNRIGAVEIPVASLQSKQAMILASTQTPAK